MTTPALMSMQQASPSIEDFNEYEYENPIVSNPFGYEMQGYMVAPYGIPNAFASPYFPSMPGMPHGMHPMVPHMNLPLPPPRAQRRFSNASQNSRASSRSRRRNSLDYQKNPTTILVHPRSRHHDDDDSSESENHPNKGLGIIHPTQIFNYKKDAYNIESSDAESSTSMSSMKRSRRRNSCLEYGAQDSFYNSTTMIGGQLSSKESDSEQDDPDSLLNRARAEIMNRRLSTGMGMSKQYEREDQDDSELLFERAARRNSSKFSSRHIGAESGLPRNEPIKPQSSSSNDESKKKEPWRTAPLTTSYTAPTVENLKEISGIKSESDFPFGGGWGDMCIQNPYNDDANPDAGSSCSFGASIYVDKVLSPEIDRYKQRARRRESIEKACLDMQEMIENDSKNLGQSVLTFIPAEGCRNGSDYIIRCFLARMRTTGFTVLKHHRSRWSKSQLRIFQILPDGKTLTWKIVEDDNEKAVKVKKRPEIDLSKCKGVRHAWTKDPETKKKTGTPVLRARCKEEDEARSFSLIFAKRTVDVTAFSIDQCKILMEGFSALCFRLKLQESLDAKKNEDVDASANTIQKGDVPSDDDWASTVYGVESQGTPSMTGSNSQYQQQIESTPWGV